MLLSLIGQSPHLDVIDKKYIYIVNVSLLCYDSICIYSLLLRTQDTLCYSQSCMLPFCEEGH